MDVPTQGAKDILLSQVRATKDSLWMEMIIIGASYVAKIESDTLIQGKFKQNGFSFPLQLKKVAQKTVTLRPQTPKVPFPYTEEDILFFNKEANIHLAGTLSLPNHDKPAPAVILISGSGPQNRNSEIFEHQPFWVIADYLTRAGIAVLRFDDRGCFASEGDFSSATSADFATDVNAAFEYLHKRKDIDAKNIVLIGHSEGGMIAPIVAAKNKKIKGLVLMAAPGIPVSELMMEQNYQIGKINGMTAMALLQARMTNFKIYSILKENLNLNDKRAKLSTYLKEVLAEMPESHIQSQLDTLLSPWFLYFINYNPATNLAKIKSDVLVLQGEKDLQVSAEQNTTAIVNIIKKQGRAKVNVIKYPNLNHLFQNATDGNPNEYAEISETLDPKMLEDLKIWLLDLFKMK